MMNGMRMNQLQAHRVAIQSSIQATCRATYAWTSWTISMAMDCDWKNAKNIMIQLFELEVTEVEVTEML